MSVDCGAAARKRFARDHNLKFDLVAISHRCFEIEKKIFRTAWAVIPVLTERAERRNRQRQHIWLPSKRCSMAQVELIRRFHFLIQKFTVFMQWEKQRQNIGVDGKVTLLLRSCKPRPIRCLWNRFRLLLDTLNSESS